jgi:hypothetical protein
VATGADQVAEVRRISLRNHVLDISMLAPSNPITIARAAGLPLVFTMVSASCCTSAGTIQFSLENNLYPQGYLPPPFKREAPLHCAIG